MTGPDADSRVVRTLTTGSKVCLLLAIPLLVGAAYFYFVPIVVRLDDAGLFSCGSRFQPPADAYALGRCAEVTSVYAARSGACLGAGLLIACLGIGLFGFGTRADNRADELPELSDQTRT